MSRSLKALVGVGAFAAGTAGIGMFGFTLAGAIATIVFGAIWGVVLALLKPE